MSKILYRFAAHLFRIYFKFYYKWEILGLNNIPQQGKLIVMANHITYLDPPIIGCIMLNRQVHFMAKKELFKNPVFGFFLRKIGQIPVKRGKPDRSALKKSFQILKSNGILGIFPEGTTQSQGNKLKKAKSGAIIIPIKSKSPILPVGIKFIGKKLKISIGKPFTLKKYYKQKLNHEKRKEAGNYIMDKIAQELSKI